MKKLKFNINDQVAVKDMGIRGSIIDLRVSDDPEFDHKYKVDTEQGTKFWDESSLVIPYDNQNKEKRK